MIGRGGRAAGAAGCLRARHGPGCRLAARAGGGRRGRRQEPAALRVRQLGRRSARALRHLPGARHAAERDSTLFGAARPVCLALPDPGQRQHAGSPAQARRRPACRLFAGDQGRYEAEAHAHLLGQLIGLDYGHSPHIEHIRDDARQIRNRGFNAAAQALRRISVQGGLPLVIQLDDLHWADDASLDFIDYLAAGRPRRAVAAADAHPAGTVRASADAAITSPAWTSHRSTGTPAETWPTSC